MEWMYLLSALVFSFVIYSFLFSNSQTKNLPPGSQGWPIIGENFDFWFSGPQNFITRRARKYSTKIFRTSIMGQNVVILCGSDGNEFVLKDQDKNLSAWIPHSLAKVIGLKPHQYQRSSPNIMGILDGPSKFMSNAILGLMKTDSLQKLVFIFNEVAIDHLKQEWNDKGELKIFPLSKLYSFTIACRCLMGISDSSMIKLLADLFEELQNGVFSLPLQLPGTAYSKALKAGKKLKKMLADIVEKRVREWDSTTDKGEQLDLLSHVLQIAQLNTYQDTEMITSFIIGMLFASIASPSSAITLTLNYLIDFPEVMNKVYEEQNRLWTSKAGQDHLTFEDINTKMRYTWDVVREVIRIMPPGVIGGFRDVLADFTYGEYRIPKGYKLLWMPQASHMDPDFFPSPEIFNPSRFEGAARLTYRHVPFGGGKGLCIGRDFFKYNMLVYISMIVRQFKLEKLDMNERFKYLITAIPENGLPIKLIHR